MTDTLARTDTGVRPSGVAAALAGAVITVLGIVGALDPAAVGAGWFAAVVPAGLLFAAAIVGVRRLAGAVGASGLVTGALAVAAVAMTIFSLAHAYALVDEDTAVILFSVFMVLAAGGLVVAAFGMVRGPAVLPRWTTLAAGVWPLATIPAAGALGDVPRSVAIAVWGLTWIALGIALLRTRRG
ncbi:hypothetical protein Acsp06_41410 [Actinomycetospora sp. NBRC 106375]|uniref:hypothetical protein n=1 Tax=Actinomycetospora sp. NBRC 106375 TaxID=3032207 RepID=UPI0024A416A9|nr:hypothetical protein [Actinomycetospora sp. NBRC 106375]GLZ47956.1 hypothetical protein Acsp06_41410 [Actinomycetospora sp. NBRC 106375]